MTKLGRLSWLGHVATTIAATGVASAAMAAAPIERGAVVSSAAASAPVDFEVFLPTRNASQLHQLLIDQQTPGSASYQKWLTPAQYAAQFGPTPASIAKVQAALRGAGLQVTANHSRSFHVAGAAGQVNTLFQTRLNQITRADGRSRLVASVKPILPAALREEGAVIVSFTGLPDKHPFAVRTAAQIPDNRSSAVGPYWFDDLKQAYDYPSYQSFLPGAKRLDGTGVKVAVLMSDLLYPNDLATYFNHEHFSTTTGKSVPTVTTVLVDGGGAQGGNGSLEASLDVQQVLGGAPGATVTLVSIPDLSDNSILDGYTYIVDNPQLYDVVNSSFGECELYYTAAYNSGTDYTYILQAYDNLFQQGNAEGITFVASSGDNGGLECTTVSYAVSGAAGAFIPGVSTPAASSYVTAVGGGNLVTTYTSGFLGSAYVGENAFGDPLTPYDPYGQGANVSGGYWGAGGGPSAIFTRPLYQSMVNTGSAYRTVPDVGMQVGGCPSGISVTPCGPDRSSVITVYDGNHYYGVIGTSVSSPEFVGALALYIEKLGHKVGDINPYLYRMGQAQTLAGGVNAPASLQYYRRNIQGYDGDWTDTYPSRNYNYLYGLGSPDVRKLFGLTGFAAAGLPQTASNP
jgi:subtilase family serine protease